VAERQALIKSNYLAGDFDGNGSGDVVVVVKGPKTGRNGVAIFTASQTPLLGATNHCSNGRFWTCGEIGMTCKWLKVWRPVTGFKGNLRRE